MQKLPIIVIVLKKDVLIIHHKSNSDKDCKKRSTITLPLDYAEKLAKQVGCADSKMLCNAVNLYIEYSYILLTNEGVTDIILSEPSENYVREVNRLIDLEIVHSKYQNKLNELED